MIQALAYGFKTFGYHTEADAVPITEEVPCDTDGRIALIQGSIKASDAAAGEILSLMYAEGAGSRNTASADAAAGQAVLNVVDAPKDPAGTAAANGDVIAYQTYDGTREFNKVASVATNAITLVNNIAKKVIQGGKVNIIGAVGDGAEFRIPVAASATEEFGSGSIYLVHPYKGEPMFVSLSNDGTASVSAINNLVFAYIRE